MRAQRALALEQQRLTHTPAPEAALGDRGRPRSARLLARRSCGDHDLDGALRVYAAPATAPSRWFLRRFRGERPSRASSRPSVSGLPQGQLPPTRSGKAVCVARGQRHGVVGAL